MHIDARGMLCPWPAVRLARALRECAPGASLTILADDERAEQELAQVAEAAGYGCIADDIIPHNFIVFPRAS